MEEDKSNIKIIILATIVLVLASICIYLIFFWKQNKIAYHMENTHTFASCIKDDGEKSFCETFNLPNEIYYSYPMIEGKGETITSLNKSIKDDIESRISILEETTNEEGIPNTPCGKIKILKDNLMYSDSHFYYYRYRIIDSDKYLSIILYEEVLSTCASSWTDIANGYIYDKKEDKLVLQKELVLENKDNLVENASKERLNDLVLIDDYKEALETILEDKQYYLYFDEEANLVITFSEPETNGVLVNFSYVDGKWNKVLTTNED